MDTAERIELVIRFTDLHFAFFLRSMFGKHAWYLISGIHCAAIDQTPVQQVSESSQNAEPRDELVASDCERFYG